MWDAGGRERMSYRDAEPTTGNAYHRVLDNLGVVAGSGNTMQVKCPAHDDGTPSLSVTRIEGAVLLYCQAGCETTDVLDAVGLTLSDLYDDRRGATYTYRGGRVVHRTPDKKFRQSGNTRDRSLFRVEHIGDAQTVYVVEGEKDCLTMASVGTVAVSAPMGAGKNRNLARYDWTPLRGRDIVVVADRDEPGREHATRVAELLKPIARSVRVAEAAVGKDVSEHITAGRSLDELVTLSGKQPRVWRADQLRQEKPLEWLASKRIPRAAVTLLIGEEGIGKSLFWVWLVAAITTGRALPAFGVPARDPEPVTLVLTEDPWQEVVLPRLIVAGADLSLITVLCTDDDGSGSPIFPRDMELVYEAQPSLLLVDAWLDTVPPALSMRDPQQARQALHPFKDTATQTGAAVMLNTHANRVASPNTRDRYGTTYALRQKARMTLYAMENDDGRLVIGPDKANMSEPVTATVFGKQSVQHFDPTADSDGTVPKLIWVEDSDMTIREHVAQAAAAEHNRDGDDGGNVMVWLTQYLSEGPRAASDVLETGKALGFSESRLRRAKLKLGVVVKQQGRQWIWCLPVDAHQIQG